MDPVVILLIVLLVIVIVILLLWYQSRQKSSSGGESSQSSSHTTLTPVQPALTPAPAPVSAPAPAPEPAPKPIEHPVQPDDLKIIEGIGPKIESILNAAGTLTFAQLAASEPAQLKKVLEEAGLRLGDPTTWPEQAKLAAEGKMDELQALQDQLKGGRKV